MSGAGGMVLAFEILGIALAFWCQRPMWDGFVFLVKTLRIGNFFVHQNDELFAGDSAWRSLLQTGWSEANTAVQPNQFRFALQTITHVHHTIKEPMASNPAIQSLGSDWMSLVLRWCGCTCVTFCNAAWS